MRKFRRAITKTKIYEFYAGYFLLRLTFKPFWPLYYGCTVILQLFPLMKKLKYSYSYFHTAPENMTWARREKYHFALHLVATNDQWAPWFINKLAMFVNRERNIRRIRRTDGGRQPAGDSSAVLRYTFCDRWNYTDTHTYIHTYTFIFQDIEQNRKYKRIIRLVQKNKILKLKHLST